MGRICRKLDVLESFKKSFFILQVHSSSEAHQIMMVIANGVFKGRGCKVEPGLG